MTEGITVTTSVAAPGITVCTVAGSIDARTAPDVEAAALPVLQAGGAVVVDLGAVEYTSSAGLRMLLLLYRHSTASGGRLVLAGLSEAVSSVMDATGFLDSFTCVESATAGIEALA